MIGARRARLWLPAGLSCACAVLGWGIYASLSAPIGEAAARGEAGSAPIVRPLSPEAEFVMPEIAAYRETLERPLFAPGRRPDAAPIAPITALQAIDLVLRGVILNGESRVALLVSVKDQAPIQLKLGERYRDWTLAAVEPNAATFTRGAETQTLAILFQEAPPKPAAAPRANQPAAAAPPQPNVSPRNRAPQRTQQQIDADREVEAIIPPRPAPGR